MALVNFDTRHHLNNVMPIIDDMPLVNAYLFNNGIPQPKAKTEQGYKMRLLCPKWWTNTLSRLKDKTYEAEQIKAGKVRKGRDIYVSKASLTKAKTRAVNSAKFVENMVMVSDAGDTVDMQEIVARSLSNPVNRRAELMVRMAGFEIYAQNEGYVGEFYTLTCPSKYHRYSKGGLNDNYAHTPKEAQLYLVEIWARIRAVFAKHDIKPFGFRVAEPHHDGCPHWHMLLFIKPEQVAQVRQIIHDHALAEDGDEKGAAPAKGEKPGQGGARFKAVSIDSSLGSATGYIAKYISKNLGFSLDDPHNDVTDTSKELGQKVKAWASVWGIRQFQQIGGAPVGVWRQLRKIETAPDGVLEQARIAADQSQWAEFIRLMGGAACKRDALEIQLLKKKQVILETGEMKANKYTELLDVIYGLQTIFEVVITRFKNWEMTSQKSMIQAGASGGSRGPLPWSPSPVNNCNPVSL